MAELKYTEERVETICRALADGATRKAAVNAVNVSEDTFARWLAGMNGASADFADRIARAEAAAELGYTACLMRAAREDWRAAESWLKRRRRVEWGDNIDVRKLDDETILRLLDTEERGPETRSAEPGRSD